VRGARQNGVLELAVTDDGPSFSLSDIPPDHGLGNLIGRLELLFGEAAQLNVRRIQEFTVVSISVPAKD
jgi:LytS/YehU family sensor histidine kinase